MGDYYSEGRGGGGPMRDGPRSFRGGGPMRGGPGSFRGGPGSFRGGPTSFRGGHGRVGPYPPQSKQPVQIGDWVCPACSNVNWARRAQCNGKRGECKEQRKREYVSQGDNFGGDDMPGYGHGGYGNGGGGNGGYGNGGYGNEEYGNDNRGYGNGMSGFGDFSNRGQRGNMMGRGGGDMMGRGGGRMGGDGGMMGGGGGMMGGGGGNMMGGRGGGMMGGRGGGMYGGGGMMFGGGGRGGETQVIGRKLRKPNAPPIKSGDWECPRCYNINFHYRERCYGKQDNEQCNLKKPNFQQYKVETIKPYGAFKENDWDCWICGEVNFASKSECFKCSVDKKDAQDEALRK